MREIPAGVISANGAILFVVVNVIAFFVSTYFINKTCLYLSPIALGVVLGYSLTKRFTFLCHLILGLGLALAPVGAYIAVTGAFGLQSILLGVSVLFWVAGFDIIYALQDEDFDAKNDLFSIPSRFGADKALFIARAFHVVSAIMLISAVLLMQGVFPQLGILTYLGLVVFLCMLVYQHTLVKKGDLSRVNMAFFTTNGIASTVFGALVILDFYI